MQNGYLKERVDGGYDGLFVSMTARISFTAKRRQSNGKNEPTHELFGRNGADEFRIGAMWQKQTKEGEIFYSISFDDPSLSAPINVSAFATQSPGYFDIVWRRPRQATQEAA